MTWSKKRAIEVYRLLCEDPCFDGDLRYDDIAAEMVYVKYAPTLDKAVSFLESWNCWTEDDTARDFAKKVRRLEGSGKGGAMSEEIRCAYCGSDLIFSMEELEKENGRNEEVYYWECITCGTKCTGFESTEDREAHARGHLEAMLDQLVNNGCRIIIDENGTLVTLIEEPADIGDDLDCRAAVEAALKEVEGAP